MKQKRVFHSLLTVLKLCTLCALSFTLIACGSQPSSKDATSNTAGSADDKTIVVGASPTPHAEILKAAEPLLEKKGYKLKIVEFNDYVQPNVALQEGELDANYFQHQPYLDDYNKENKTDLLGVASIHFEPMSVYSSKHSSLKDIPDNAQIAVPSDATNEARALLLLEANGVIKLKKDAGLKATVTDIEENPHNIKFLETEAASIARTVEDVDFAVVNGNYALSAKLDTKDALATEDASSVAAQTYANIIACRPDDKDSAKIKALIEALTSPEVKEYIEASYEGTVITVF